MQRHFSSEKRTGSKGWEEAPRDDSSEARTRKDHRRMRARRIMGRILPAVRRACGRLVRLTLGIPGAAAGLAAQIAAAVGVPAVRTDPGPRGRRAPRA